MLNLEKYFAPKGTDKEYFPGNPLKISLILRIDSYKFGHPFAYPDGIEAMSSYGEARVKSNVTVVPFGFQMYLKNYLSQTITRQDILDAEKFAMGHFGRPLFAKEDFLYVLEEYKGKLPLIIRTLPEGMRVKGGLPLYNVTVFDKRVFWMSAAFETPIQRAFWYPTTIASLDTTCKDEIEQRYEKTGADKSLLPFALHDFGGRGVTSAETAEIGGAAHLLNFMGSDTVEGVVAANYYYSSVMSAFSVFATEHAIECSWGGGTDDAIAYIRKALSNAVPGGIVSIVLDGYDIYREAELCCTVLRDEIIACKAKVVFRPDSGDMLEIIPRILAMQAMAFGTKLTSKGYKQINYVGIIQGDGIDRQSLLVVLDKVIALGYSADVIVFGSGGGLLQKLDRDTLKFAQKASCVYVNGAWKGIAKDPVSDPGKKSKAGVMTTVRSRMTGELMAADLSKPLDSEYEDLMQLVYYKGRLFNETTLDAARERVSVK
jgi:nicotinamide phosphoribosyltransferase